MDPESKVGQAEVSADCIGKSDASGLPREAQDPAHHVLHQYAVRVVGRSSAVLQQFYALSVERKIKHPAVVAICKSARQDIFGQT